MAVVIDYDKCRWKNGNCDCGESADNSCCCTPVSVPAPCCRSNDVESSCGCEGCAEVCPVGAITREERTKVDEGLCIECGACVDACPYGAISL